MEALTGTVSWFNEGKGFGFIRFEQDGKVGDAFAHYSSIITDGFKNLKEGQKVTFQLVDGPKGPQACSIIPS
jgi:CspA family cold shock protein